MHQFVLFTTALRPYLSISDLAEVKDAVRAAQARWRNIGVVLGIPQATLTDLAEDRIEGCSNPESRFEYVLETFLQQKDEKPSMKRLADAMASRDPEVNLKNIAEQLRETYHIP